MVDCSRVLVDCSLAVDSGRASALIGPWFGCWLSCWSVVVDRRSGDSWSVGRLLVGCSRCRLICLSVAEWAVLLCRLGCVSVAGWAARAVLDRYRLIAGG